MGHRTSMVNSSLATRPNCKITVSKSSWVMSWKFFTEAMVTLPLKLSTKAPTVSFHRGGLLYAQTMSL
jgi:hypothetical protein